MTDKFTKRHKCTNERNWENPNLNKPYESYTKTHHNQMCMYMHVYVSKQQKQKTSWKQQDTYKTLPVGEKLFERFPTRNCGN